MKSVFRLIIAWLFGVVISLGFPLISSFMDYAGVLFISIIVSVGLYFVLFERKKSSWLPIKTLSLLSIVWVVIIEGIGAVIRTLENRLLALAPETAGADVAGMQMISMFHVPGIIALFFISIMPLVCGVILAFILSKTSPPPVEEKPKEEIKSEPIVKEEPKKKLPIEKDSVPNKTV